MECKAQNLVNNGDFEIHDTCPNNQGKIIYATGWQKARIEGTPDYFNTCAPILTGVGIPYNAVGYQNDYRNEGNGYAGEFLSNLQAWDSDYAREYIYTKLIDSLLSHHKYLVSAYVSLGNNCNYATKMGVLFTDTSTYDSVYINNNSYLIIANAQVTSNYLLGDTINWMLVQDTFVSQGGEKYVTIGNFNTTINSDTVRVYSMGSGTNNDIAYYYIDGVSVYDVTGGACNNYWDAGFDKYILAGDSICLGAMNTDNSTYIWVNAAGGATYLSNNSDSRPWSKPTQTTTYYVTKTCPNNNVFYDTVTVYVKHLADIKHNVNYADINIYPNPANDKIYIETKKNIDIALTDLLGNEILRTKENEIDVISLPNGIYFLQVKTNENVYSKKIIIQH
ncbi:MAG TPA: T9SS type A sorting domain-containing protein [Bacteroidia bacterium]|nr:T9SS type A sorting domain-containing protein [Bacteroidia bacterium]